MSTDLLFDQAGKRSDCPIGLSDLMGTVAAYAPKGRDFGVLRQSDRRFRCVSPHAGLIRDLNLETIFEAMSEGDDFILDTVRHVVPEMISDGKTLRYRQEILKDTLRLSFAKSWYLYASDTVEDALAYRTANQPGYAQMVPMSEKLQHAVALLELLLNRVDGLKRLVLPSASLFKSEGLKAFCTSMDLEWPDEFLREACKQVENLKSLSLDGNMVIASRPGAGLKGTAHILRRIVQGKNRESSPTGDSGVRRFRSRDFREDGVIILDNIHLTKDAAEMEEAGFVLLLRQVNLLAGELFRFFSQFRFEIAFYTGCAALHEALRGCGVPICFPDPLAYAGSSITSGTGNSMSPAISQGNAYSENSGQCLSFRCLVDAGLALSGKKCPVSNDLDADGKRMILVTGANQGGKSTFLRSVGLAQLFMQCGLFVTAECFRSSMKDKVFTFFAREEDATLASGRLEAELLLMDGMVGKMTRNSMILLNEAFATTTEHAGARIASDLVHALCESGVCVLFVTHLFEFADQMAAEEREDALFLRAERLSNGNRSFRMEPGMPLDTSYGEDLFGKWLLAGSAAFR